MTTAAQRRAARRNLAKARKVWQAMAGGQREAGGKNTPQRKPTASRRAPSKGKKQAQGGSKRSGRPARGGRWSQKVTTESRALDLDEGVFTWDDPKKIARSLKRSAEASKRRKGTPLQSAMSMLNFYVNRAGGALGEKHRKVLRQAKSELRRAFGKPA